MSQGASEAPDGAQPDGWFSDPAENLLLVVAAAVIAVILFATQLAHVFTHMLEQLSRMA